MNTSTPATTVAGRLVADYQNLRQHPGHLHPLDAIVGYVVRETVRGGVTLAPHVDVAAFEGATRYGAALELARAYRVDGGYALPDALYRCGCRS